MYKTLSKRSKVSILILTYNAPKYVYKTLKSLKKTSYDNYEVIVFDNNSSFITKLLNLYLFKKEYIDKLIFSKFNILFAPGNNRAFDNISDDAEYVVLLNSDIKIKDPMWLDKLLEIHEGGVTSFGAVMSEPQRADGYCLLTDRELYAKYKLDEAFEWWWSVTKFQAEVMAKEGKAVKAVQNHEKYLHHYGGASRKGFNAVDSQNAKGLNINIEEVKNWFENGNVEIIDKIK